MSQSIQSASWKSHAAGTLAKRNQMLSLQRSGTGLPPRVNSTAKLDTSAYSNRSVSQSSHIQDVDSENAHIVSPSFSRDLSFLPRIEQETLQTAFNESHASRFGHHEGAASPTPFKALPPQRVQPSRVHRSMVKHDEQGPKTSQSLSSVLETALRAHSAAPSPPKIEDQESSYLFSTTHSTPEIVISTNQVPQRVPTINPFIPSVTAKPKIPRVDLVIEDSDDSSADAEKTYVDDGPELTAEEKLDLQVLQEQLGHLLEAVKSKKLSGSVKVSHGMNALRLGVHLNANRTHVDGALLDLQTALYKLAWDYNQLFFESEPFGTLIDVANDGRCLEGSKIALQVLLVLFERDARVNGGSVREQFFGSLHDLIVACLNSEDDEFKLGWGLWFASYFSSQGKLASELYKSFPLDPMLLMLMADCQTSVKYKIMQALRNMTAGCFEMHQDLVDHLSFVPWLLRACAKQKLNPNVEERMLHVQTLGVVWNLCSSPDSASKMLMHGVYDALAMVLEMPFSDTQEIALLAFADIASTEYGRLRLLDSRLAVSLCGLARSLPPPTTGVYEGIMRVFFALSETENIKRGHLPTVLRSDKKAANSLKLDEHFFRSMGIIDVIGHLLRNGGEMTKLLALGTLVNICQNPKNIVTIQKSIGILYYYERLKNFTAPDVERIANSTLAPPPLRERAQALTLVLNDRSRNSCIVM